MGGNEIVLSKGLWSSTERELSKFLAKNLRTLWEELFHGRPYKLKTYY